MFKLLVIVASVLLGFVSGQTLEVVAVLLMLPQVVMFGLLVSDVVLLFTTVILLLVFSAIDRSLVYDKIILSVVLYACLGLASGWAAAVAQTTLGFAMSHVLILGY